MSLKYKYKKGIAHLAPILLVVALFLVVGGYFLFSNAKLITRETETVSRENTPTENLSNTQVDSNGDQVSEYSVESVDIVVGEYNLKIPTEWSANISHKSSNSFSGRFYPDESNIDVYMQVVSADNREFQQTNPFEKEIEFEEIKKNGSVDYTYRRGVEKFLDSNKKFIEAEYLINDSTMLLTLYTEDNKNLEETFGFIIRNVSNNNQKVGFVQKVLAAVFPQNNEETVSDTSTSAQINTQIQKIADFDVSLFKSVEIMEGPYPERITDQDLVYKDGFAKFYKFQALKGQRIQVLAEEGGDVGSFIETELYDQNGEKIVEAQTRLSFPNALAPYSGDYYLIVNSFKQRHSPFLLKIFDLDQVQNHFYARYSEGEEIYINLASQQNEQVRPSSPQAGVILISFTNPIEVNGTNVRYFRESDNGCITCSGIYDSGWYGDVTHPISVTTVQNGQTISIPIKLTKLFLNQLLVQPSDGEAFEVNKSYRVNIDFGPHKTQPGTSSGTTYSFYTY